MFGLNGFNPISLLATTALGPVGGIVAQLATQIFSSMAHQVLQQLGQQMGLPQEAIDLAHDAFDGASGNFGALGSNGPSAGGSLHSEINAAGEAAGASPAQIGDAQRKADGDIRDVLNNLSQSDEVKEAKSGKGGNSWLRAMAEVLGKKLDDLAHEMEDKAGKVNKEDPSTSTDFTVVSQEFNMLMNATTNALKTIGEAMGKSASRQ